MKRLIELAGGTLAAVGGVGAVLLLLYGLLFKFLPLAFEQAMAGDGVAIFMLALGGCLCAFVLGMVLASTVTNEDPPAKN